MTTDQPPIPAEEPPAPTEQPQDEQQGRVQRFVRSHIRGLTIGAVIAGIGSVLSLVGNVLDLRDRIFDGGGAKPVPTLTVERELTTDVPWETYLKAHPDAATQSSYTEDQLLALGEEFRVTGQVEGRSGKRAVLTWEVFQPPGSPLPLPAWAPRRLEQRVSGDGRIEFRPWVVVPDGAGELYPKFLLTIDDTEKPPTATGPTLTIARG